MNAVGISALVWIATCVTAIITDVTIIAWLLSDWLTGRRWSDE